MIFLISPKIDVERKEKKDRALSRKFTRTKATK
jgi:hypothetical protein